MKQIIFVFLLSFSYTCFASSESISIIIKPSAGLIGTTSFNIHPDDSFTLLFYKSTTEINETSVPIEKNALTKLKTLSSAILNEIMKMDDYSRLPEYKQTISVAITRDKVTKSISTRRHTQLIDSLIKILSDYDPVGLTLQIEKK